MVSVSPVSAELEVGFGNTVSTLVDRLRVGNFNGPDLTNPPEAGEVFALFNEDRPLGREISGLLTNYRNDHNRFIARVANHLSVHQAAALLSGDMLADSRNLNSGLAELVHQAFDGLNDGERRLLLARCALNDIHRLRVALDDAINKEPDNNIETICRAKIAAAEANYAAIRARAVPSPEEPPALQ